jgi:hypothetical protein
MERADSISRRATADEGAAAGRKNPKILDVFTADDVLQAQHDAV